MLRVIDFRPEAAHGQRRFERTEALDRDGTRGAARHVLGCFAEVDALPLAQERTSRIRRAPIAKRWRADDWGRPHAALASQRSLFALTSASPAWAATPIAGRYLTEGGAGIVQVAPCGGVTCGRLVQILKAKPGAAATDVNNHDSALRRRPIQGIAILSGFIDRGDDWRGTIYDPRNGKSYKSIVSRNPNGSLKV